MGNRSKRTQRRVKKVFDNQNVAVEQTISPPRFRDEEMRMKHKTELFNTNFKRMGMVLQGSFDPDQLSHRMLVTTLKDNIVIATIVNLQAAQSAAADKGDVNATIKATKYLMRFAEKHADSVNAIWPLVERGESK